MITCAVCGTEFPQDRTVCPCCGRPAPELVTPVPEQRAPAPPPARVATGPVPLPPPAVQSSPHPAENPPAPAPESPTIGRLPTLHGETKLPLPSPTASAPTAETAPPSDAPTAPPPTPIPPAASTPPAGPTFAQLPKPATLGSLSTLHGESRVELPERLRQLVPGRWRALLPSFSRWDFLALGGGALGAALWHFWSKLDVRDPLTPKLILALPLLLILLRKPIDLLLAPLEVVKSRIPRLFLIGVGLATPYLVTNYLYTKLGISNFPLARQSIVWGTLLSYIIMRVPETDGLPKLSSYFRRPAAPLGLWLLGAALLVLGTDPAWADDFGRDWRRLEDGMRTPGWAQAIAGTTATVINALVNGALIFQTTRPRPRAEGEPEDDTHYTLDVRTEDQRTKLAADGDDRLWIYALLTCDKPAVDTASLTQALAFTFGGEQAGWMSIRQDQFTDGFKAVQVVCTPPTPETEVPENAAVTVTVSGQTAEGDTVEVPVRLELADGLRMEVEILS